VIPRAYRARAWAFLAAAAVSVSWAGWVEACPFCSTAKTGSGYLVATVVLLVVPLAAIGGFVLWVRRCTKATIAPAADRGNSSAQSPEP
jgi:hypothetical protein